MVTISGLKASSISTKVVELAAATKKDFLARFYTVNLAIIYLISKEHSDSLEIAYSVFSILIVCDSFPIFNL